MIEPPYGNLVELLACQAEVLEVSGPDDLDVVFSIREQAMLCGWLAYVMDDEGLDIHGQVHELFHSNGRHGLALFQARTNCQLLFRGTLVSDRAGR